MNFHTTSAQLTPTAPFDFARSLQFIGMFRPARGQQQIDDQTLTKAFYLNGQIALFQVASRGTVEQPALDCTIYSSQPLNDAEARDAVEEVRFYFSLDDDLSPFYELGNADPQFAPLIQALYGLHQVKFGMTAFENACWAILSQRNLMAVSHKMKAALVERYGGVIEMDGARYPCFPEASRLGMADAGELESVIGNARKAEWIYGAAQAFSHMDEHFLRGAPYATVEKWLSGIKGMGEWSRSFVLVRGLGRMDCAPIEKNLLAAAQRVYSEADEQTVRHIASQYGALQGYWAYYLRVAG